MFSSLRAECGSAAGAAIPRQQHARGCGHSPLARRKAWVFWLDCVSIRVCRKSHQSPCDGRPQIECAKAWRGKAGNSPHSRHHAQWQPGSLRAASSSTRGGTAPRWGRPSSRQPVPRGTRRKKPSWSAAAQRRLKSLAMLLSTPENAKERTPQHPSPTRRAADTPRLEVESSNAC